MEKEKRGKFNWQMLELKDGITTSNGSWYHITKEEIENYIPGLLKKYSLKVIIKNTDAWLQSAGAFSLLLYFILAIIGIEAAVATAVSLIFYIVWFFNLGSFVIPALNPLVRIIQSDGFMYTVSAAILIYFSFFDLETMWMGIGLLFLFKVDLLSFAINWLMSKRKKKTISRADRVLNMMLIKLGLKEGLMTKNIQQMEQEFLRVVNYNKEKGKS